MDWEIGVNILEKGQMSDNIKMLFTEIIVGIVHKT